MALKEQYKKYRNTLTKILKQAKREYYKDKIKEAQGDQKRIWSIINQNRLTRIKKNIERIKTQDGTTEDELTIANELNTRFAQIGNELAARIPREHHATNTKTYKRIRESLFSTPVTESEIRKYIKELNPPAATGPDGIPTNILTNVDDSLTGPL
ncbi:uncharacterized protein [Neodiprion pinetum]|uniref:uncharacterized protein n=1 Tax=Neodiprion pinetum TaxID=441929 RepID=UPI001EDE949F|nr:uncharacterized protein LOC124223667 [Neodiprion pinetum]